ncbi:MAG: CoA ligase, partial [Nitrospinae bacterium]|nr:CoA ligase [Nitrospinota bacterium]
MRAIDRYTAPDAPLAFDRAGILTAARFLGQAVALADRLPDRAFAVNLCADRRSFMSGFVAAMIRRQTTLLPGDTAPETLALLAARYPSSHYLYDDPLPLPDGATATRIDPAADAADRDPADAPAFDPAFV